MRKWIALLLMALLLLTGCGRKGKPLFEPVYFYYPRTEYDYGSADSVITWEAMDGTGHMEDWAYLMGEYFSGPIDEALENPFPPGTELLSAGLEGETFCLELSREALALPEYEFSLGCACLSMTFFELTQAQQVVVTCGPRQLTIPRDGTLLLDDHWPQQRNASHPTGEGRNRGKHDNTT